MIRVTRRKGITNASLYAYVAFCLIKWLFTSVFSVGRLNAVSMQRTSSYSLGHSFSCFCADLFLCRRYTSTSSSSFFVKPFSQCIIAQLSAKARFDVGLCIGRLLAQQSPALESSMTDSGTSADRRMPKKRTSAGSVRRPTSVLMSSKVKVERQKQVVANSCSNAVS